MHERFDDEGSDVGIDASRLRALCEAEGLPPGYFEALESGKDDVGTKDAPIPGTATRYAFGELVSLSAFGPSTYSPSGAVKHVWQRWIDLTRRTRGLLVAQLRAMLEDLIICELSSITRRPTSAG
jgi:hypothetical protein